MSMWNCCCRIRARHEANGFIVHFFDRSLVERLAAGYELLEVGETEEGDLPRRLFVVFQRKAVRPGSA